MVLTKILRLIPFTIMSFLLITFSWAINQTPTSDTAIITFYLINRPPVITEMSFNADIAYEDTNLYCNVKINDENPDTTELKYKWFINEDMVKTDINNVAGFNSNDIITCEVTPYDEHDKVGQTKVISIIIKEKPIFNKITGFITKDVKNSLKDIIDFFDF